MRVQVDLAVNLVGQQAGLAVIDGGRCFVAGGFDPEHAHIQPTAAFPASGRTGFAIRRRDL
jgi:hypothetical protein